MWISYLDCRANEREGCRCRYCEAIWHTFERTRAEISGLCARESGRPVVEGVSLSLREGEIVGLYGLLGSGRTELLEALAGVRKPDEVR